MNSLKDFIDLIAKDLKLNQNEIQELEYSLEKLIAYNLILNIPIEKKDLFKAYFNNFDKGIDTEDLSSKLELTKEQANQLLKKAIKASIQDILTEFEKDLSTETKQGILISIN